MLKLLSFLGAVVLSLCAIYIGYTMATTPEMAWSQSKDKCVLVTNYKGEQIANGCKKVADGKMKASVYPVP